MPYVTQPKVFYDQNFTNSRYNKYLKKISILKVSKTYISHPCWKKKIERDRRSWIGKKEIFYLFQVDELHPSKTLSFYIWINQINEKKIEHFYLFQVDILHPLKAFFFYTFFYILRNKFFNSFLKT